MKVYVLTEGEYSDYRILCVTTDKEKATRLQDLYLTEANIEEYDSDEDIDDALAGKSRWNIDIDVKTHSILNVHECGTTAKCIGYMSSSNIALIDEYERHWFANQEVPPDVHWRVSVSAFDEDHAKKIACDKLAKYLAEQNGL